LSRDTRYWDSDCFLALLKKEQGRIPACRSVIKRAASGEFLIVTSALTLAEVLNLKGRPPLPSNIRDEVTNFYFIYVHNVTRRLAEDARNLVWDAQVDPKDAIHVATAIQSSIPLLNTYDSKLLARNGVIGASGLKIVEPEMNPERDLFDEEAGDDEDS